MHVLLYTYSTCSFCARAKTLLQRHRVTFEERKLDGDRAMIARLAKIFGGNTMPYVMIDGDPIGGLPELERMVESGELT